MAAIRKALDGEDVQEVYLFGSRVDDSKRGGDIDLLVYSAQPAFDLSLKIASRFFSECEEKIDVLVLNPQELTSEQALFLEEILSKGKVRIQ